MQGVQSPKTLKPSKHKRWQLSFQYKYDEWLVLGAPALRCLLHRGRTWRLVLGGKQLGRIHRIEAVLDATVVAAHFHTALLRPPPAPPLRWPRLRSMPSTRSRLQVQAKCGPLSPSWGTKRSSFSSRTGGAGWCPHPAPAAHRAVAGGQRGNAVVVLARPMASCSSWRLSVAPARSVLALQWHALDHQARRHLVVGGQHDAGVQLLGLAHVRAAAPPKSSRRARRPCLAAAPRLGKAAGPASGPWGPA